MTLTRYDPRWEGTDPKRLRAFIQGTQGICTVSLVNPRDEEIVPPEYFDCTELVREYVSPEIPQMVAGMGGMNVRVRIEECNDSPTEVQDCRRGVNPGPIYLLDTPRIDPTPGTMGALRCSPLGMMLDTCTPECMARLAPIRGNRDDVVSACNAARSAQGTADDLGIAAAIAFGVAAALVIAASRVPIPFVAKVLGVLALIAALVGAILLIAQAVAQATADRRWGELSTAQMRWMTSTNGVLTVCCIECVGDLLTPHRCER
jgi:hypothetical protein